MLTSGIMLEGHALCLHKKVFPTHWIIMALQSFWILYVLNFGN
jgi:hypothetical protein